MKKKLAILLALSMVLSMVPMSVFGATKIDPIDRLGDSAPGAKTYMGKYEITNNGINYASELWVDVYDYIPQSAKSSGQSIQLSVELTGGVFSSADNGLYPLGFQWWKDVKRPAANGKADPTKSEGQVATTYISSADISPYLKGTSGWAQFLDSTAVRRFAEYADPTIEPYLTAGGFDVTKAGVKAALIADGLPAATVNNLKDPNVKMIDYEGNTIDDAKASGSPNPAGAASWPDPDTTVRWTFDVLTSTRADITIMCDDGFGATGRGQKFVKIPLFIYSTSDRVTLNTKPYGMGPVSTLTVSRTISRGLTITPGDVVMFNSYAYLSDITVAESAAGSFGTAPGKHYYHWFRFDAPRDYKWVATAKADLKVGTLYGPGRYITPTIGEVHNFTTDNGLSSIVIGVDIQNNRPATASTSNYGWPEAINISGLVLVADDRAKMGKVEIDAWYAADTHGASDDTQAWKYTDTTLDAQQLVIHWVDKNGTAKSATYYDLAPGSDWFETNLRYKTTDPDFPSGMSTSTPGNRPYYLSYESVGNVITWDMTKDSSYDEDTYPKTLYVADHVRNEVYFTLLKDEKVAELRSGEWEGRTKDAPYQTTAKAILYENAPNAWGGTQGLDVTFTVSEGVTIVAATVSLNNAADDISFKNLRVEADPNNFYQNKQGLLVKPDSVRLLAPLQNKTDKGALREVIISLDLSIEAGYATKYADGNIYITASGGSLANLADSTGKVGSISVLVAHVNDPIAELSTVEFPVITNNTAYFAYDTIGDISITENELADFRLERGKEIWVYIIGGRQGDVDFECNSTAQIDDESGMTLSKGRAMTRSFSNVSYVGMAFTVNRESDINPATITLTDCKIKGMVYPEVEYKVVVSGNAVAQTDYVVYGSQHSAADLAKYSWMLYDEPPYEANIFTFEDTTANKPGGTIWDAPSDGVTPGYTGPGSTGEYNPAVPSAWTINEFTPGTKDGYPNPFIMYEVAPGYKIGLMYVRSAAEFLGLEPNWDPDTSTATLTGVDKNGNPLTVVMQSGATTASINETDYDIADKSGSAPFGTCTALNINAALYLPLRFLVDAYGGTIGWDAATSTATIYK